MKRHITALGHTTDLNRVVMEDHTVRVTYRQRSKGSKRAKIPEKKTFQTEGRTEASR